MKKNLLILVSLCLSIAAFAQIKPEQTAQELLCEDYLRAGNLHHRYERLDENATAVPEGYKAFYVSHYGRHGSRYLASAHELDPILEAFAQMADNGLLTKKGKQLYSDFQKLAEAHDGMYGMLTQRGGNEHRAIAKRLYERATDVFTQPGRDSITCVSTAVPRCIQSMANFTLSLKEEAPNLKIAYYSGDRYKWYLNKDTDDKVSVSETKAVEEKMLRKEFNPERLIRTYFKDLIDDHIGKQKPEKFFYYVFKAGSISQCLDGDVPDILSIFNEKELYTLWKINNLRTYGSMCNSVESNGERNPRAAYIVKDIIEKADLAMADDSHVAADLRFAHDSGVAPLISFLQLEGNDVRLHIADAEEYWYCFQNVCMGTNLQIIFYRNDAGNILVKFLHNERERSLPALTPVYEHYYSWDDVRAYMSKLVKETI